MANIYYTPNALWEDGGMLPQTPANTTSSTGYTTYTVPAMNSTVFSFGLGQLGSATTETGAQMQQGMQEAAAQLRMREYMDYQRRLWELQAEQQRRIYESFMYGNSTVKAPSPAAPLTTKALTAEDREALEGELPF